MNQNNFWKWFFVLFVVGWSVYELYPPTSRNLIDQFASSASNTDSNFVQIVSTARELEAEAPNRTYANLRDAIGANDISRYFPDYRIGPAETDTNRAILNRLQREAAGNIKLGLDLQGGTAFMVRLQTPERVVDGTNVVDEIDRTALVNQAIEVLRKRVDRFGVAEPVIQPAGEDRILIQLPGLSESDMQLAKETIQRAAFLEFRLVHPESEELVRQGLPAPGHERLALRRTAADGREFVNYYLVKRQPEQGLTGKYVARASVTRDPVSNQPEIMLRFDSEGSGIFADITTANVGRQLAIVLDGELYSAPVIRQAIRGGSASISGDFTLREAFELANVLENPLAAPLRIEEQRAVDPSLGRDSIASGYRAAIIGVVLVAGFMLVYYMVAGVLANIALILNILILLGVMCAIDATLTVPGIAGIVLTMGMAVDANVLIYERIREELAAGKSLKGSIAAGYQKAFSTIFDSNLTTLIASIILIFMGTGPVQGFGVTLTIGVAASMFTALTVTRLFLDTLAAKGVIKSLPMLHIIRGANIDFLRWAKPAAFLSLALVVIGVGYGLYRGADILGVDFAGGDSVTLNYNQRVDVDQVRSALQGQIPGEVQIQYQASLMDQERSLQVTTAYGHGDKVRDLLNSQFPEAGFSMRSADTVGPVIGAELLRSGLIAALLAMFGILIYVAMRYEFSFGVAAIVATLHDVIITMGIFFISGRELNAPIVAAVLTIIGFSMNDTIVIFDRIREDLKMGVRGSFKDIINQVLNKTLSRTIITSGTTLLSTMALYLFGGEVINDFAFFFLIGIIAGTYSTIYIASAMLLWWHKGERPKMATPQMAVEGVPAAPVRA